MKRKQKNLFLVSILIVLTLVGVISSYLSVNKTNGIIFGINESELYLDGVKLTLIADYNDLFNFDINKDVKTVPGLQTSQITTKDDNYYFVVYNEKDKPQKVEDTKVVEVVIKNIQNVNQLEYAGLDFKHLESIEEIEEVFGVPTYEEVISEYEHLYEWQVGEFVNFCVITDDGIITQFRLTK